MVLESEFTADVRVEKEIKSLHSEGFHVSVAAYTFTNKIEEEKRDNYSIYRKKISKWIYKSSAAALILPLYFRFWHTYLDDLLKRTHYDVIHVHDLPLSKVAWKLARKYNLRLVCDQHEFYSNWIIRTKHYNTLTGKVIRLFSNWASYETKYLNKADMVITVAESLRELYIERLGVKPEFIITLPNTPAAGNFNPDTVDKQIVEKYAGRFVLFYAGGLDHLRGIDFIAEGVALLKNEISNILFLVAGKENKAFQMDQLIRKFQISEFTDYLGWVPLNLLSSYIAASQVCLFVPRADNLEINNTIVTKIYQYAALGKPIIVSEARMMKEFVESNKIGFSVEYGDLKEFCNLVQKIYRNPDIAISIKDNAQYIASRNTWEQTSRKFIERYSQMIAGDYD
jgi:glycosyltransferase involved in cell wall biosynthesis